MRRTILSALVALAALALPAAAGARTIEVHPGDSIQRAVDRARAGDTVLVHAGTYRERGRPCPTDTARECAVVVRRDGIRLVGRRTRRHAVLLRARAGQDDGISVARGRDPACLRKRSKRVHGSYVAGLTVRGFRDNGVFLFCVDRWRVTRVRAVANREYGIFPSHSVSGRVDHSFASGANDTGIYVGQSDRARMDHNTAAGNLIGFEIENSSRVRADHNVARANTAGLLSVALPGLDVKSNQRNAIDRNDMRGNNRPNACLEAGDVVCKVPPGTGILLLATDGSRVESNRVTGNRSLGIGLGNYCVELEIAAADCAALDIEPSSDLNRVTGNRARGNGARPAASVPSVFAASVGQLRASARPPLTPRVESTRPSVARREPTQPSMARREPTQPSMAPVRIAK